MEAQTFDDDVLSGLVDAPHDDGCVERARGHAARVGAPRHAVHPRRVEAPLLVVSQLKTTHTP